MKEEEFIEIMDGDYEYVHDGDCNIFRGLVIMRKYVPDAGISGSNHDEIYSCDIGQLLDQEITIDDAKRLRDLGWMVDEYAMCMKHFC
jgi:hypothetical protein